MQLGIYHRSHRQNTLADNQSKALQSLPTSRHKLLLLNRHKNVPEAITRILAYPNTRSVRRTLPGAMAKTIFTAAPLQEPSQENFHRSLAKSYIRSIAWTVSRTITRTLADSQIKSVSRILEGANARTITDLCSQPKQPSQELLQESSQIPTSDPSQELLQKSLQEPLQKPSQEPTPIPNF